MGVLQATACAFWRWTQSTARAVMVVAQRTHESGPTPTVTCMRPPLVAYCVACVRRPASVRIVSIIVSHISRAAGVASSAVGAFDTMIGFPSSRCFTRFGVAPVPHTSEGGNRSGLGLWKRTKVLTEAD